MNSWTALLAPIEGSLIPSPSEPTGRKYLMSDGRRYTTTQLRLDTRNTSRIANSELHRRLNNGERDLEKLFERRNRGCKKLSATPAGNLQTINAQSKGAN